MSIKENEKRYCPNCKDYIIASYDELEDEYEWQFSGKMIGAFMKSHFQKYADCSEMEAMVNDGQCPGCFGPLEKVIEKKNF